MKCMNKVRESVSGQAIGQAQPFIRHRCPGDIQLATHAKKEPPPTAEGGGRPVGTDCG